MQVASTRACKAPAFGLCWFDSSRPHHLRGWRNRQTRQVEGLVVAGSNPAPRTTNEALRREEKDGGDG